MLLPNQRKACCCESVAIVGEAAGFEAGQKSERLVEECNQRPGYDWAKPAGGNGELRQNPDRSGTHVEPQSSGQGGDLACGQAIEKEMGCDEVIVRHRRVKEADVGDVSFYAAGVGAHTPAQFR
jgi:hypothetical protein